MDGMTSHFYSAFYNLNVLILSSDNGKFAVLAGSRLGKSPVCASTVSSYLPECSCMLLVNMQFSVLDLFMTSLITKKRMILTTLLWLNSRGIFLNLRARSMALTKG